jgi:hypothetical protein
MTSYNDGHGASPEGSRMMSRRNFLNGTVEAGLALSAQDAQPASAQTPAARVSA